MEKIMFFFKKGSRFRNEPFFSQQLRDGFDVLSDFEGTKIRPTFVTNRKIPNVNELIFHPDPEVFVIFLALFKTGDDVFDHMDAGRRMAHRHLSADDRDRTVENPFFSLREVFDPAIGIDKGQIQR